MRYEIMPGSLRTFLVSRPTFSHYAAAVLLGVLGVLARAHLTPILGPSTPFIFVTVTISAWYGGLKTGLLTTFVSCVLVIIFPHYALGAEFATHPSPWPLALSILLMGVLISALLESLHRAEQRAARSLNALTEINNRYRLMVNSIHDYGIVMLNENGIVTDWNTGANAMNGYLPDEIIGEHFSRFYPVEDVTAGKPEMELREAAQHGRFEDEGWRLRKDGTRFWGNVIITPVRDETGKLCGFSKIARDMTERRQAEERARLLAQEHSARIEAEAANKAKDQFLSVLSHELRTPLNSITGWISLLREGELDEEMTQTALESIERSTKIQTRLVEDLLDASRMLTGKLLIEKERIELNALLDGVADGALPAMEEKGLTLETRLYPTPIFLCGDAVRLQQAFSNLLQNARKFTPEGGHITIEVSKAQTQVEIVISDNGIGIAPEMLPHIFENFRQADSSHTRQHGGLGLGLAIVRYIVEAHDGTIEAHSAGEGKGTTFHIKLPLEKSTDTPSGVLPA
jgi:PAS domain S-box-containing protein